jgi:hypothetical protein
MIFSGGWRRCRKPPPVHGISPLCMGEAVAARQAHHAVMSEMTPNGGITKAKLRHPDEGGGSLCTERTIQRVRTHQGGSQRSLCGLPCDSEGMRFRLACLTGIPGYGWRWSGTCGTGARPARRSSSHKHAGWRQPSCREPYRSAAQLGSRRGKGGFRDWAIYYNSGRPSSALGPGLPEQRQTRSRPTSQTPVAHRIPSGEEIRAQRLASRMQAR